MRSAFCTAFLVVIASASAALASPIAADSSGPTGTGSRSEVIVARSETGDVSTQHQSESKPDRGEGQILSTNFPRPKPVQIYWFFGGR